MAKRFPRCTHCLIWAKTARSETERNMARIIGGYRDDEGDDAHTSSHCLVYAAPC